MKLSKRGEYGLKALIDLASQEDPQTLVQMKDIAQRQQIPVKFLEQIMLAMKNGGILRSRAGLGGGYYLARPAAEITLGQVVRLLEGPLAPISCVSQMAYERCVCEDEATCGLRLAMLDVRNAIAGILDKTTLADVSNRVERAQRAERRPARSGASHRAVKTKPATRGKR
jgi:Rrf2 family protein